VTNHAHITVPLVPPSVNHYKVPCRMGHGRVFVTSQAKAFKAAIALLGKDQPHFAGKKTTYRVEVGIYLGAKQKGDIDNFCKVVLDGLKDAGIIHTDAAIVDLIVSKRRDYDNPRTEIDVYATDAAEVKAAQPIPTRRPSTRIVFTRDRAGNVAVRL